MEKRSADVKGPETALAAEGPCVALLINVLQASDSQSRSRSKRVDAIRRIVYRVTAPCFRGDSCPDCTVKTEAKCPDAVSPRAIRRGSITRFSSNDVPIELVSDRMNASRIVLDEQYDERSEAVKLEQRRSYLGNI